MLHPHRILVGIGIFVALIASPALLSGCEFGNKSSTALTGYDTISGYYLTLPQTITFSAQIGAEAPRTKNGMVSEMPDFLKAVMSNPTTLVFDDPVEGIGSIRSRTSSGIGFYTLIDPNLGTFGASEDLSATVHGCRFVKSRTTSGKFSQLASQQEISNVWARGKISLDYQVSFEMQGDDVDCAPMREQFKKCFVDGIGCSSDPDSVYYYGLVEEMLAPFVNTGLITSADIDTVKKLSYRATYE